MAEGARGRGGRRSVMDQLSDFSRSFRFPQPLRSSGGTYYGEGPGGRNGRRNATTKVPSTKSVLRGRLRQTTVYVLHEDHHRECCTMTFRDLYRYVLDAITVRSPGSFYNPTSCGGQQPTSTRTLPMSTMPSPPPPPPTYNSSGGDSGHMPRVKRPAVTFQILEEKEGEGDESSESTTTDRNGNSRLPPRRRQHPPPPPPPPPPAMYSPSPRMTTRTSAGVGRSSRRTSVPYRERLGGYLHPRDMRRLVTPFSATNQPELIVRRHVMLLNFDPLRAIVLRDRLLLLVPDNDEDDILRKVEKRLRGGLKELENEVFGETFSLNSSHISSSGTTGDEQGGGVSGSSNQINVSKRAQIVSKLSEFRTKLSNDMSSDGGGSDSDPNRENSTEDVTSATAEEEDSDDDDVSTADEEEEDDEFEDINNRRFCEMQYELLAVDVVLEVVVKILMNNAVKLSDRVHDAMSIVRGDHGSKTPSQNTQERLRVFKDEVAEMQKHIQGFEKALTQVLNDDEDMALMNLSRVLTHPERFVLPVSQDILSEESDEPELILEAYLQLSLSALNELELLKGQIDTTEELVSMKLDTVRNRLLMINTILSLFAVCIGAASLVGSVFGMNLINHLEDELDAFAKVLTGTLVGTFLLFVLLAVLIWKAFTWL